MSALPDSTAPVISVVVVNWNGGDEVMTCLHSLATHPPTAPWEAIVVDNASRDGSVERIRRELPWVRVIANADNLGLAAGNNQGIRASQAEYVLISNPDVRYQPGAIDALYELLRRRDRAAFAVARLRDPDGALQTSAGDLPTFSEAFIGRALPRRNAARRGFWWHGWDHDVEQRIGHGGEACYLVRRDTIEEVGPQDERFWLDWEGIDWSRRVAEAGWEIWYCPQAEVVHVGGVSLRQVKYRWIFFSHRGMYRYFRLRYRRPVRSLLAAAIALRAVSKMAVATVDSRTYDRAR